MSVETSPARCSSCGRAAPRQDLFGIEPDLLCEPCADRIRKRTRPSATGRLASTFAGGPTPVTAVVLLAAVALYLADHVWFGSEDRPLPDWLWALMPWSPTGSIGTGEAWRLVTSALLHGGVLHILFNGIWIWSLGRAVEGTRGPLGFVFLFVGSAGFASAAQWAFGRGPGIGLSGVLYALAGYLWMRRRDDEVAAAVMNPYTARTLGAWFVMCILLPQLNIANWAHGGGLVWGLAAGWVSTRGTAAQRWSGTALLAAATVAAAWWVSTGHVAA